MNEKAKQVLPMLKKLGIGGAELHLWISFLFRDLNASAASVEDANALLDTLDAIAQTLAVESSKARDLIKLGM